MLISNYSCLGRILIFFAIRVVLKHIFPSVLASGSMRNGNNFTALQNPSITQTKSMLITDTFTNGVPRTPRSLPVSVEPTNETEGFPERSRLAITSVSVHSSPSAKDSRTDSRLTEHLGDGEGAELFTENGYGFPSIRWQSDAPCE